MYLSSDVERIFCKLVIGEGWQLGRSPNRISKLKTKDLLFCGKVTHKVIGVAISNDLKVIISIEPINKKASELLEALYINKLFVFSLGESWELRHPEGRAILCKIFGFEEHLIHLDNKNILRLGSEKPKIITEVLSRVKTGAIIWNNAKDNNLETKEISNILYMNEGNPNLHFVDMVISQTITWKLISHSMQTKTILAWIQHPILLSELAREVMWHYKEYSTQPGLLVLENYKLPRILN